MIARTIVAILVLGAAIAAQTPAGPARFDIGRPATADEIRALDIDVRPDGQGLPPGSGTVRDGAAVFGTRCASCHGDKGEGGTADRLVGRNEGDAFEFATNPKLIRTVGSYWPYATTLYDYTFRSMPFTQPGTLTAEETYSVVAYVLFLNGIVPESAVMDARTLPQVVMPARDRFVKDTRAGGHLIK